MHKFNIDKFIINKGQIHLVGWGFIDKDELDTLVLRIVLKNNRIINLTTKHSMKREDVAIAFQQSTNAMNSGFFMLTALDIDAEIATVSLYWHFKKNGLIITELTNGNTKKQFLFQQIYTQIISSIRNKFNKRNKLNKLKKILSNTPITIIIDHNLGGGANIFRDEYIAHINNDCIAVLLTFNVSLLQYCIIINLNNTIIYEENFNELDDLFILFAHTNIKKIVYNCAVSFRSVFYLIDALKKLKESTNSYFIMMVHDHFIICPSYFLLNQNEQYCTIPSLATCHTCLSNHPDPFIFFSGNHDIKLWRLKWLELIEKADEVRTFSYFSKNLVLKAFPILKDNQKITICPHKLHTVMSPPVLNKGEYLHIGIVGFISKHKGSDIVANIDSYITQHNLKIKITIFGTLESNTVSNNITILGSYEPSNLSNLIEKSGANIFLLPSICPETFSYVAHELVAMRVPFTCFNFGAPSDLAYHYDKGMVLSSMESHYIVDKLINFWHRIYA